MLSFDPNNFQLEDLDRLVDQSQEMMRNLERVQQALAEVTGTGTSDDGLVEARVDSTGGILEVVLNPRAMRLDSVQVGAGATEAVRAAQQDAQRRMAELITPITGEEVPDQERMRERLREAQEGFSHRMDEREDVARRRAWDR